MREELLKNVGDFYIDCERMPSAGDLKQHEGEVIDHCWQKCRPSRPANQAFRLLLASHRPDFTFLAQSCEDRTGHCSTPITPFNVGSTQRQRCSPERFSDQ